MDECTKNMKFWLEGVEIAKKTVELLARFVDDVESYKSEKEEEMIDSASFLRYLYNTAKKEAVEEILKMLLDEMNEMDEDGNTVSG